MILREGIDGPRGEQDQELWGYDRERILSLFSEAMSNRPGIIRQEFSVEMAGEVLDILERIRQSLPSSGRPWDGWAVVISSLEHGNLWVPEPNHQDEPANNIANRGEQTARRINEKFAEMGGRYSLRHAGRTGHGANPVFGWVVNNS